MSFSRITYLMPFDSSKGHGEKKIITCNLIAVKLENYIIYTTKDITAKFRVNEVINLAKKYQDKYPIVIHEGKLSESLDKQLTYNKKINFNIFNENEKKQLLFHFAELLEKGHFIILEKATGSHIEKIKMGQFEQKISYDTVEGGRAFYLFNGTMFLKATEWGIYF